MTLYKIIRFYKDEKIPSEVIAEGVSLKEAKAHCNDPTTRREGEWFDGYEKETDDDEDR